MRQDRPPALSVPGRWRAAVGSLWADTGRLAEAKLPGEAAAKSVINFGMPELAGATASSVGADAVERIVRNAITHFEPRILPRSLEVSVVEAGDAAGRHIIGIEIRAEAWNVPMPDSLYIRTEVDLETGRFQLNETSQGG